MVNSLVNSSSIDRSSNIFSSCVSEKISSGEQGCKINLGDVDFDFKKNLKKKTLKNMHHRDGTLTELSQFPHAIVVELVGNHHGTEG